MESTSITLMHNYFFYDIFSNNNLYDKISDMYANLSINQIIKCYVKIKINLIFFLNFGMKS